MKQSLRYFCLLCTTILFLSVCWGQSLQNTTPPSFKSALMYANIDETYINRADADFINNAVNNPDKSGMYVIAQLKESDISPAYSGTWETLEDGTMIWRVIVTGRGARALYLHFDRFNLPAGSKLYVYDINREQVIGGYNELDNTGDKGFAIGMILGESIIIEYVAPQLMTPGQKKAIMSDEIIVPDLHISQVSYIFRGVEDLEYLQGVRPSESCEVNINCPEGDNWQVHKRSVVRIYVVEGSSAGYCTGTLINNLTSDGTPYILTANHCGPNATTSNFNQWRFDFDYEYTACTGSSTATTHTRTGCSKIAEGSIDGGSDFFLLKLNQAPDNAWNPIYAGWRRDNTAATLATGIHHPAGDYKKISSSVTISTGSYTGCASNAHWRITDWRQTETNQGVTEGGSSGSALFDQDGYVVGTLTGGAASCSYPHNDYYGKMFYHWDQNSSTASQQLKPWLDPNNAGNTVCPMYDPNNPDTPVTPPVDPDTTSGSGGSGTSGTCHKAHYPLNGTLVLYRTENDGYLAGTNPYHDKAKADYFTKDATTEYVANLFVNVGHVSGAGSVTFCVWADDNGKPGAVLGSKTVSMSSILANSSIYNDPQMPSPYPVLNRRYICHFNTSIPVSGNFFAGVTLPMSGEFGLVTNSNGDGANSGWEQKSDGTWVPYSDSSSWGISLTHAIFPEICEEADAVSIPDVADEEVSIYPNPSNGEVHIRMAGIHNPNTHIEIYDYAGRLVKATQDIHTDMATLHLSSFSAGVYVIIIRTEDQIITRKISIIK